MVLESKFDLGEKVYFYDKWKVKSFEEECPFCQGDGWKLLKNGRRVECLSCKGNGKITFIEKDLNRKKICGVIRSVECFENLRGEKRTRYTLEIEGKNDYYSFEDGDLYKDV